MVLRFFTECVVILIARKTAHTVKKVGSMQQLVEAPRLDRRTARTRQALRDALAAEIQACGDLSRVTVTAVTDRAGVTRRTFYSHYREIPDLVASIEEETIVELSVFAQSISNVSLDQLEQAIAQFEPCPGSIELLDYIKERGHYLAALLGEGGDPAFAEKLKAMVRKVVEGRASEGFVALNVHPLASSIFDYYLSFVISAEVGVLVRWLTGGMQESTAMMAQLMTALMFVRPGDLYGRPLNFDVPSLALSLLARGKEHKHV